MISDAPARARALSGVPRRARRHPPTRSSAGDVAGTYYSGVATSSTCDRTTSSRSRPSTSTRRCTPTPGTSACRRRCSDRKSATTCCARSSRRGRTTGSSISGCGSGRALLWNRDWRATDGRHRHQPVLRRGRAPRPRSAARRSAAAAVRRRHVHQGLLARRARAPLAGGAARRCSPRRRGCSRPAARCSSTRTCGRTRRSRWGCAGSTRSRGGSSAGGSSTCGRSGCASRIISTRCADIPELEQRRRATPASASRRIRYYTPIVGGFVENILMRMAERAMARRAARRLRTRARPGRRGCPGDSRGADRGETADRQEPGHVRRAAGAVRRDEARPAAVRAHSIGPVLRAAGEELNGGLATSR